MSFRRVRRSPLRNRTVLRSGFLRHMQALQRHRRLDRPPIAYGIVWLLARLSAMLHYGYVIARSRLDREGRNTFRSSVSCRAGPVRCRIFHRSSRPTMPAVCSLVCGISAAAYRIRDRASAFSERPTGSPRRTRDSAADRLHPEVVHVFSLGNTFLVFAEFQVAINEMATAIPGRRLMTGRENRSFTNVSTVGSRGKRWFPDSPFR